MERAPRVASWPAKRDELRWRLATSAPRCDHHGPLRLAPGAVVAPQALAPSLLARRAFLWIVSEATPAVLVDLAGAPLDELAAVWEAHGGPPEADPPPDDELARRMGSAFASVLFQDAGATRSWLRRWQLPARFDPELTGGDRAVLRYAAGQSWGVGVAMRTLLAWRTEPLPPEGVLPLWDPFADLDEPDPDLGLYAALELPTVSWDPQWETKAEAQARILRELRRAVRMELARIAMSATGCAEIPPTRRTGLEHLSWLARYHFGNESFSEIARSAHCTRQSVTEAVKAAADLVSLPLRAPSPAGRPRIPVPPRVVRVGRKRR